MAVNWYEDSVKLIVDAADLVIEEIAFSVEGQAKANITRNGQVDTGFMRAAVYTNTAGGDSNYASNRGEASSRNSNAEVAPEIKPQTGAVVAAGAEYSIYQEIQQSFLFRGLEQVQGGRAESIIIDVGNKEGLR